MRTHAYSVRMRSRGPRGVEVLGYEDVTSRSFRLNARRMMPARCRYLAVSERFDARGPSTARAPSAALELAVGGGIEVQQPADLDLRRGSSPLLKHLSAKALNDLSWHMLSRPCLDINVNTTQVDGLRIDRWR